MKLYFALNEGGTRGDIALHTKIAVVTAIKNTQFELVMMYTGERNEFTRWLEAQGVEVRQSELPYLPLIKKLTEEGRYHMNTVGHWLRTNIAFECEEEYALYTDIDVFFRKSVTLPEYPLCFKAAPEFQRDHWNYFNAGVMYINVRRLRETYQGFETYLRSNIEEKTHGFHDQIAYNDFYRREWEKLPIELNWKPYWGINEDAQILHFHGPKLGAINAILNEQWNWESDHGIQIGSLFASNIASYRNYLAEILNLTELPKEDYQLVETVFHNLENAEDRLKGKPVDLSFMSFKMYPDELNR